MSKASASWAGRADVSRDTQLALADELEQELRALLAAWFPRCIDTQHGGFLCDFDAQWKPTGPHVKALEFQARTTRALCSVAAAYPDEPAYRRAADHGIAFLRDRLWDDEHGGWFRAVDRGGMPIEAATKHAHGMGYALSACALHHRLGGSAESLELGQRAFEWLDRCAHDRRHGGWFGQMLRDGTVVTNGDDVPLADHVHDVIGTPYGLKDANTMSDVLGGLADLYEVWPDTTLRERLRETLACVRDRMCVAPGAIHMFLHADWTPVPEFSRYGQALQTASHLCEAAAALDGTIDARTKALSKDIVDVTFAHGWDTEMGGIYFGGSTFGAAYAGGVRLILSHKPWWAQAEGLRTVLSLFTRHPNDERDYFAKFQALWAYVRTYVIDARNGGWLAIGSDCAQAASTAPKSSMWRDASHESRALLDCTAMLREHARGR